MFLEISDMYVSTGYNILIDTIKTEEVIIILTNKEYSSLIFLKIMQIIRAQRIIPQALISFITSQRLAKEERTVRQAQ